MSEYRDKGPDEIFCRSCGEPVKEKAEICPHCGVRNEEGATSSTSGGSTSTSGGSRSTSTKGHDPSQYETTVSDRWYYAIGASLLLWIVALALSSMAANESVLSTTAGFLGLIAWVGMPIGIYFDGKYIRANSKWNPNTAIWLILSLIPLINIVVGAVFLYRRHEVFGTP